MRPRPRGMRTLAFVHVGLALLVQLAPSIHLLSPHEHEAAACKHAKTQIHFDASPEDGGNAPCPVCANLLNRQILSESASVRCELCFTPAPKSAPFAFRKACPALQNPDTRGPPHAL